MGLPLVVITRTAGGIGRLGQDAGEGVAALVSGGVAVSGGAQLNTVYKLYAPAGAEAIGLTAAYDTSNKVLVRHHIDEFFRLNPTGELHLMVVAQTVTMAQMCDMDNNYLKKVLRDGQGRIRKAGVVRNPAADYTAVLDDGLDADVLAAIPKAQELADDEYANDRPINNIVIEGRQYNGAVGDAADLRAISGGPYRDVSVVIAQDSAIAALDAEYTPYAAVGAYLGVATNKAASECFAQPIDRFNLTSVADGRFLTAYLSNNNPLSNLVEADIDALHDKGYIFGRTFNNFDGVYLNQSHVCAPETDDYNASEMRDVINRAVRLTRPVLIPLLNSTNFPVVAGTGRIERRVAAGIEADIRTALEAMSSDVSVIQTVLVDPAKDDLGQDHPSFLVDRVLRVVIGLIPKGKAEQITVTIGYTTG